MLESVLTSLQKNNIINKEYSFLKQDKVNGNKYIDLINYENERFFSVVKHDINV